MTSYFKTVAEESPRQFFLSPLIWKRAARTALGPGKWGQEAREGSWGGGCLEQSQPNETLSPDIKEVAMSRELGPGGGHP